MNVTIKDIAKCANVSNSTVSRVITNDPRISSKTREKVLKIIKEMNYHPNIIARSLVNKCTNIIGVIIPGSTEKAFQHPFYAEILSGISSVAQRNHYKILLSTEVSNIQEEKQILTEFAKGGVAEGIILMTSRINDPSISELKNMNFPFVMVGRPSNDKQINWVDNDNFSIAYELTEHFIKQGHKKIAFIGVSAEFVVTLDRLNGYRQALKDNNLSVDEDFIIEGKFNADTGYELIERIFEKGLMPTATIACDDYLAFGAIKFLNSRGIKVPEDMAVAGFNNVPLSDHFTPPLTSVEINPFKLGQKSFELLLSNINSSIKSFDRAIIPAEIIVRNSSQKKI